MASALPGAQDALLAASPPLCQAGATLPQQMHKKYTTSGLSEGARRHSSTPHPPPPTQNSLSLNKSLTKQNELFPQIDTMYYHSFRA